MKIKNNNSGLTLIELLLCMLASSIVILIVGLIMLMAFNSWRTNNAYADMRRNAAFATSILAADIREASYSDLSIAADNTLTVPSAVTNTTSNFIPLGDTLLYNKGADTISLIPEGVQNFTPFLTNDGVLLTLELANTEFAITLTNQLFINTRN